MTLKLKLLKRVKSHQNLVSSGLTVRRPAVAGTWYSDLTEGLRTEIKQCFLSKLGPGKLPKVNVKGSRKIVALISPHAGYMYSGPVAAQGYDALASDGKPDVFIILGPNHTGLGSAVSIMVEGVWNTPLGNAQINDTLAKRIHHSAKITAIDASAHAYEHSIELQLPFLQFLYGSDFSFVPICMMLQDLETSREVGQAIAEAITGENAAIIASSDMTHGNIPPYLTQAEVQRRDQKALEAIQKLDEIKLLDAVETYNVTMCGLGPVIAAITVAKALRADKTNIIGYKTTGDITREQYGVVGYASVAITKP